MTTAEIAKKSSIFCPTLRPTKIFRGLVDDKPFREQLELDSMDFLDIVMELRKRHRIQIPEEDYKHLASWPARWRTWSRDEGHGQEVTMTNDNDNDRVALVLSWSL